MNLKKKSCSPQIWGDIFTPKLHQCAGLIIWVLLWNIWKCILQSSHFFYKWKNLWFWQHLGYHLWNYLPSLHQKEPAISLLHCGDVCDSLTTGTWGSSSILHSQWVTPFLFNMDSLGWVPLGSVILHWAFMLVSSSTTVEGRAAEYLTCWRLSGPRITENGLSCHGLTSLSVRKE